MVKLDVVVKKLRTWFKEQGYGDSLPLECSTFTFRRAVQATIGYDARTFDKIRHMLQLNGWLHNDGSNLCVFGKKVT